MKREQTIQKWTLELAQNRIKSACILLALLLSCALAGLRAPLISTIPLLVLVPFSCQLCFGQPLRILLYALPCGIVGGLFAGSVAGALFFVLLSLLGAVFGVVSALLLKLSRSRTELPLKILLPAAAIALLLIPSYASFNLFGNPVGWISSAVRANSYAAEHYPSDSIAFQGVTYDSKHGLHKAVFSTPLGRETISFDRRGEIQDGYQDALSIQFCAKQEEFVRGLLLPVENSPLCVSAESDEPLGITQFQLSNDPPLSADERKKALQLREEALGKLSYTLSFGEFSDLPAVVSKPELIEAALRFQQTLAEQGVPYRELTLTAADAAGNIQRVKFSPTAQREEIESGYRSYRPDEK